MEKKVIFFEDSPPLNKAAIHIRIKQTKLSTKECMFQWLKEYLGNSPLNLVLSPQGKPYLAGSPLHFNLSHSDNWIAMAFNWQEPIGIDIEVIRPLEEMDLLISECFSDKEQSYIKKKDSLIRFWEIWTRKEACCKAAGIGIKDNMSHWDCHGKNWIFTNQVWVKSLLIQRGLSCAVAFTSNQN